MGWETRRGKRVYYRKERVGRRVRSVYCGSGERGERAAREDEERRAAAAATSKKTRTLAAPQPVISPCPSSPLRVMGRPVGATPRPRNYEEWRRSMLRKS